MAVLQIKTFGGISPKVPARYLQDSQAQVAVNCPVFSGSLQPLNDVSSAILTLTKTGTPQTIYRFGQDSNSETNYWFHWPFDVDVCRSQVAGDTSEWTFYTGDGAPKATYSQIALAGAGYPFTSRPLGLPAPITALSATSSTFTPTTRAAEVLLTSTMIAQLTTTYGIEVGIVAGTYTAVSLSSPISASSVASAVNAASGVNAAVSGTGVLIKSDATGDDAKLFVRYRTGSTVDTSGSFTYTGVDLQGTGVANSAPGIILQDSEIGSISAGDIIQLNTTSAGNTEVTAASTYSASAFASFLNSALAGKLVATAYGSCVAIAPGSTPPGAIFYRRYTDGEEAYAEDSYASGSPGAASVLVTQATVDALEGNYMSLTVNGTESFLPIPAAFTVSGLASLVSSGYGAHATVFGLIEPFAIIGTDATGTSASIRLRSGTYPTAGQFAEFTASGVTETPEIAESRVYAWTWVNKEAGFEFESAPSPASAAVDVRAGQSVTLSGREAPPTGYVVTHWRLYRATAGVYLFVTELQVSQTTFTDATPAEELGEELPSLTWLPPPASLRGLTNLPNGIMAGFTGRDVYFCDPYHPHAWPVEYNQTVDYPVVGLGRMDTTLAVLTTGTPYFIQGAHPDSMVVVKSDLEQACASKRSIVSANGVVIYASPDGLVMLKPGGSGLITENYFTRAQWQTYFNPSSIHAYQHDNKYIAFYATASTAGGFIYDMTSGQFVLHSLHASAGFNDLQGDKLFVAFSDRTVRKWLDGSAMTYTWRSKKFTMPQVMGFSCAQLEAEAYPVTVKVYSDGSLVHTQTVANRRPFRLPVTPGRDWEFQIEGNTEVFAVAMAQSMEELAGV